MTQYEPPGVESRRSTATPRICIPERNQPMTESKLFTLLESADESISTSAASKLADALPDLTDALEEATEAIVSLKTALDDLIEATTADEREDARTDIATFAVDLGSALAAIRGELA